MWLAVRLSTICGGRYFPIYQVFGLLSRRLRASPSGLKPSAPVTTCDNHNRQRNLSLQYSLHEAFIALRVSISTSFRHYLSDIAVLAKA